MEKKGWTPQIMMKEIYISDTNCITPLGFDVASNVDAIMQGSSGITQHSNNKLLPGDFYAAIIDDDKIDRAFLKISHDPEFTRLEKMMIIAMKPVIENSKIPMDSRVGLIFSTTKGNVTALDSNTNQDFQSAFLHEPIKKVAGFFGFKSEPIVVSNACVSGILAISVAKRMIQAEAFDHVFVVAADEVSAFVLSGFNSFQAMSDAPCKPYSKNRTGVSLGEAAAAILVTSDSTNAKVKILGDGSINDANHISGPSRTGEGLYLSIQSAMIEANISPESIDYISAHGTATPFNDEMEAIAFNRHALGNVPINSLKGYYGHTLGTSGLLETVLAVESADRNILFASLGFDEIGVSQPINVIAKNENKEIHTFLKTASGFGGCNTAVIFEKQ